MGCVYTTVDRPEGKLYLLGAEGFLIVDIIVHDVRPATQEELEAVFKPEFYNALKDEPGVHLVKRG